MRTNFGKDWTRSFGDMLADRQTDEQTHSHHKSEVISRGGKAILGYRSCDNI